MGRRQVDHDVVTGARLGALLRRVRKAAGFKSVDEAVALGAPFAKPTLYLYERGELTPTVEGFTDLVAFYVDYCRPSHRDDARPAAVASLLVAVEIGWGIPEARALARKLAKL